MFLCPEINTASSCIKAFSAVGAQCHGFLIKKEVTIQSNAKIIDIFFSFDMMKKALSDELPYDNKQVVRFVEAVGRIIAIIGEKHTCITAFAA